MRRSIRFSLLTLFAGLALLVSACSSTGPAPEGLAFQDDSQGDAGEEQPQDDSSGDTTEAPTTTTEAPTTTTETDNGGGEPDSTVPRVNRPTNRTCSTNDHSVAFGADVVLQDPSVTVAGPFSVSVPAGTYDITVTSWLGFEEDPAQTMEQWYFTTDSGYTSPLSTDSSPELIWSDVFSAQTLTGDTTSVTLFHKAPGMAVQNSTHPLCIGFRAVAAPATTTTTTTTAAPTTTTTEAEIQAPATTAATTTTVAPTTTTIASGVAPAELALTGASELSLSLGLAGAALTLAGSAALFAARRRED